MLIRTIIVRGREPCSGRDSDTELEGGQAPSPSRLVGSVAVCVTSLQARCAEHKLENCQGVNGGPTAAVLSCLMLAATYVCVLGDHP